MPKDLTKQFQDKEFVKEYTKDCETGQDFTAKLIKDEATLNSPDLIVALAQWLRDAEDDLEDNSKATAQAEVANLPSSSSTKDAENADSAQTSVSNPSSSEADNKGFFGKPS